MKKTSKIAVPASGRFAALFTGSLMADLSPDVEPSDRRVAFLDVPSVGGCFVAVGENVAVGMKRPDFDRLGRSSFERVEGGNRLVVDNPVKTLLLLSDAEVEFLLSRRTPDVDATPTGSNVTPLAPARAARAARRPASPQAVTEPRSVRKVAARSAGTGTGLAQAVAPTTERDTRARTARPATPTSAPAGGRRTSSARDKAQSNVVRSAATDRTTSGQVRTPKDDAVATKRHGERTASGKGGVTPAVPDTSVGGPSGLTPPGKAGGKSRPSEKATERRVTARPAEKTTRPVRRARSGVVSSTAATRPFSTHEEIKRAATSAIEAAGRPVPRQELFDVLNEKVRIPGQDPFENLGKILRTGTDKPVVNLRGRGYFITGREAPPA